MDHQVLAIADCLPQVTFDLASTDRRGLYASVSRGGFDCVNDGVLVSAIDGSATRGRFAEIFRGHGWNADLEIGDFLDSDQMGGNVGLGLVPPSDDGWTTCNDHLAVIDALWTVNVASLARLNVFEPPLVDRRGHLQHLRDCC